MTNVLRSLALFIKQFIICKACACKGNGTTTQSTLPNEFNTKVIKKIYKLCIRSMGGFIETVFFFPNNRK